MISALTLYTTLWKRQMVSAYSNVVNSNNQLLCSFSFPNFETEEHWPTMIRFLGTPEFQSTSKWENYNKIMKNQGKTTNQKNIPKDVLNNIVRKQAYTHSEEFEDGNLLTPYYLPNIISDYTLSGASKNIYLVPNQKAYMVNIFERLGYINYKIKNIKPYSGNWTNKLY